MEGNIEYTDPLTPTVYFTIEAVSGKSTAAKNTAAKNEASYLSSIASLGSVFLFEEYPDDVTAKVSADGKTITVNDYKGEVSTLTFVKLCDSEDTTTAYYYSDAKIYIDSVDYYTPGYAIIYIDDISNIFNDIVGYYPFTGYNFGTGAYVTTQDGDPLLFINAKYMDTILKLLEQNQ